VILSSCGSSTVPQLTGTLSRTAPRIGRPPGTPVGVSQRVAATGTTLVVDVTRVIDPLLGSGAKVPSGMVAVGVVIDVHDAGPSGYDSSATSDFSLRTAAGAAMPVFAPAGVCETYIQDFMNAIAAGESRTGCIAYLVRRGKPPTAVKLAPDGGSAHTSVTWLVR
jgi:hypothetical protein